MGVGWGGVADRRGRGHVGREGGESVLDFRCPHLREIYMKHTEKLFRFLRCPHLASIYAGTKDTLLLLSELVVGCLYSLGRLH